MLSSGNPLDFNGQDGDSVTTSFKTSTNKFADADLQKLVSYQVQDTCWIQFKFRCTGGEAYVPEVSFKYVFGSEEYYEYVNSQFNDVFAFLLNGKNIARLPHTDTNSDIVSINNVNYEKNTEFFHGNDPGNGWDPVPTQIWYDNIEADGFTSKLTAVGDPYTDPEQWNTIKMVVGDVGDALLDSWVLIEGGTFTCVDITQAPSTSSQPSASPSMSPSVSSKPTGAPSESPSVSSMPTGVPSQRYVVVLNFELPCY